MVLTRSSYTRATFPLTAATAFLLRGSQGPYAKSKNIPPTLAAAAAGLGSMAFGSRYAAKLLKRAFTARNGARRGRAFRGRRKNFGIRRRRRVGRRFIAGRGPYQRKGKSVAGRRLNTRMARNDYDSTREIANKGFLVPTTSGVVTGSINVAVYEYPLALTKLFDYDEYKLSNIQMVLTPLSLSNGSTPLYIADAGEPYIYIIPKIHPESWSSTPTLNTIKSTPGVMRFHMLTKGPIVVNLKARVPVERTVVASTAGSTYDIQEPSKLLTWVHNPQTVGPISAVNYPNYGTVQIYLPQLAAGSFEPKWRVDYYSTINFRGNRALAEV